MSRAVEDVGTVLGEALALRQAVALRISAAEATAVPSTKRTLSA
jgi:hypothetical protein